MITWFETLSIWHWLGLMLSLAVLDIMLGTSFFLIWQSLCCLVVAISVALFPDLMWQLQLAFFAILSIASIFFWHMYLQNIPINSDKPKLNRRGEGYIGKVFTLKDSIINGRGAIKVDDTTWRIAGPDLAAGNKVIVVAVDSTVLVVVSKVD